MTFRGCFLRVALPLLILWSLLLFLHPHTPRTFIFVLDASGSMALSFNPTTNVSKIQAAKNSLKSVVSSLEMGDEAGLIVFYDCGDIRELLHPTTEVGRLGQEVDGITPIGGTPIADSLRMAYSRLGVLREGREYHIVLITDGGETCSLGGVEDAFSAGMSIWRSSGGRIRIDVIAVGMGPTWGGVNSTGYIRATYMELASRTGGFFMDASDEISLRENLRRIVEGKGTEVYVLLPLIFVPLSLAMCLAKKSPEEDP